MMARPLALLAGAYLLGSISFSLLVVWLAERVDVRTVGSGNAGATNVLRTSGRWLALLVVVLDVAKGLAPVRVAQALGVPPELAAGAGLAAMLGHSFPLYFGFRGGKGVATGFGVFLALVPLAAAAGLAIFVATVWRTRFVSLGSIVAAVALPLFALAFAWLGLAPPLAAGTVTMVAACAALVLFQHRSNVGRLRAGSERRLGERSRA
jgi:glycerol-3-phosphate acyltransferase PlsY